MTFLNKSLIFGLTALVVACSPINAAMNRGVAKLNWESGKEVDEGNFGDPTYNNTVVQSAYRDQNGLLMDLSRRFEKDVPTMINFEFNSSRIDREAQDILMKQAAWISQFPEIKFRVYGHTDLVGSDSFNKRLGLRRANAAVNFLIAQGIDRERLEAVVSYGETQPLVVTEGRERKNRRTVTEVIGFAKNFIGDGLDGKYAHLVYRKYVEGAITTPSSSSSTGG